MGWGCTTFIFFFFLFGGGDGGKVCLVYCDCSRVLTPCPGYGDIRLLVCPLQEWRPSQEKGLKYTVVYDGCTTSQHALEVLASYTTSEEPVSERFTVATLPSTNRRHLWE